MNPENTPRTVPGWIGWTVSGVLLAVVAFLLGRMSQPSTSSRDAQSLAAAPEVLRAPAMATAAPSAGADTTERSGTDLEPDPGSTAREALNQAKAADAIRAQTAAATARTEVAGALRTLEEQLKSAPGRVTNQSILLRDEFRPQKKRGKCSQALTG